MIISDVVPLINDLTRVAGAVQRFLPEIEIPGLDFAGTVNRAKEDMMVDISPEYRDLINRQIEVQTELQEVTFLSNIERANHETRMAPVRNIRVA